MGRRECEKIGRVGDDVEEWRSFFFFFFSMFVHDIQRDSCDDVTIFKVWYDRNLLTYFRSFTTPCREVYGRSLVDLSNNFVRDRSRNP